MLSPWESEGTKKKQSIFYTYLRLTCPSFPQQSYKPPDIFVVKLSTINFVPTETLWVYAIHGAGIPWSISVSVKNKLYCYNKRGTLIFLI